MSGSDGTYGPIPHDRFQPYEPPYETCVEGETWIVRQRSNAPGTYDFDWVSGPNKDYGFTSFSSDGSARTTVELDEEIRQFLTLVAPDTGYLPD